MKIDAAQQKELLQAVETLRSFIENLETKKGCISCYNWRGGSTKTGEKWLGGCAIAGGDMPPQEIIENGCEHWKIFDDIPFI